MDAGATSGAREGGASLTIERVDEIFEAFFAEFRELRPDAEASALRRAYEIARECHAEKPREDGSPFVSHPLEAARVLLGLLRRRADLAILCAALLHDTVEDSQGRMTVERLEREFGAEVAALVDGVTHIAALPFRTPEVAQTESYRKMLLSMARDIRVILIKLADRLHNMRTLGALDEPRRRRIAQETLDIYAPIAHRLGIGRVRWELEDLAFKHLDPEHYHLLADKVDEKREQREQAIAALCEPIRERLAERGIVAEVGGRPKHLLSVWRKMERLQAPFEEIFDLHGIRVITETRDDCYRVLGVIHDLYTPVADRFKDYIAMPKGNMYQSLHTAVVVPERRRVVEIQIRTREMHVVSEIGIAAHYAYKEGIGPSDRELEEKLGDFIAAGTAEWRDDTGDPKEFMEFLKTSLYQDEVFVFTPKGGVKRLPRGATPIDFAYAIHTDVGNRLVGAKVNGRIVPLRYQLRSGEVVEVISSPQGQPNEAWLKLAVSGRAKSKIRRWLQDERMEGSVRLGREMLARELKKRRLPPAADRDLEDVSQSFGLADAALLHAKIGQGDLSVASVIARLHPETRPEERKGVTALERIKRLAARPVKGLRIGDVDGLLIRIAQCCQPLPGDKVVGIITKGRGISVHRVDCPNTFDDRITPERRIEVEWDVERDQQFLVRLIVHGADRQDLLVDVASVVSRLAGSMRHGAMSSDGEGQARGEFLFNVRNLGHLERIIEGVRRVRGVLAVERAGTTAGVGVDEVDEEG